MAKSSNLQQSSQAARCSSKCCKQADLLLQQLLLVRLSSGLIVDQSPTKSLQCWAQEGTETEQLLFQIDRTCERVVRMAEAEEAVQPPGHLRPA